jgi:hypothetical protein
MVARREFAYIPSLPNQGSPHQTPASLMIDVRYANMLLVERWTWDRFARLCQFLQHTPYEVASMVALKHDSVDVFRETKVLPRFYARQTALLLTALEYSVCRAYSDDVLDPFAELATNEIKS